MGAQGIAVLDFGAFTPAPSPGSRVAVFASVTIRGIPAIAANSAVEAWQRFETDTPDHSVDEQMAEQLRIYAGNIVPGDGFTIYGECLVGGTYGKFNVNWVWN